ncbi:lycopene cyclase domain-containing protein [Microbacterium sp. ISL-103]|uniref:lycopene cyclase domain-containing protein n=1 Tax=Microbacterium sp. ISL-103 TaxID=2819156 RepID=UPI001BE8AD05|nr:lycopene cyclase domain-containing protein [Microbacterium sp. ISL-103]MBT2475672.1 lycopene cyclase domain-containing protein [Microbacterium sp. ISL-103]
MTYVELSAWFVGAAVVAAIALSIVSGRRRAHLGAMAVTVAVLLTLTAVFDSVMIATGLFHYSPDHLLGVHIGLAPLEDFAYPLAGAVLLPALWAALRARRRARSDARSADGELA